MKPRVNNPAWVRAIQDVIDALPSEPADQINADPNTTGFQQFLAGTGSMLSWWGDIGSNAKTNDTSVIGDVCGFDILPGSDDVYNSKTGKWEKLRERPELRAQHGLSRLGRLRHGPGRQRSEKQKAAWSAAAHLGGKDLVALDGGLSVRLPALSQQPLQHRRMGGRRLRRGLHHDLPRTPQSNSYNHPNARDRAAHSRHLPVLQRRRGRAGEDLRRQGRCPDRRRQHRGGLGEADRPDRPRQADRALQGLARPNAPCRCDRCFLSAGGADPATSRSLLEPRRGSNAQVGTSAISMRRLIDAASPRRSTSGRLAPHRRRAAGRWARAHRPRLARLRGDLPRPGSARQPARSRSGFDNWRPVLYAYLLWAVALGVGPGADPRRARPAARCSCCRRCCSPSRW